MENVIISTVTHAVYLSYQNTKHKCTGRNLSAAKGSKGA